MQDYNWDFFCTRLQKCMQAIEITDTNLQSLPLEKGMRYWHELGQALRRRKGCLFLIGNGASASMCSHFAADLNKNAKIRTQVFTDPALLTAVANDLSYAQVFAEPLSRMAEPRDMLLTISSSGKSPNILSGIDVAHKKNMSIVTLSGMDPQNDSRKMGNLNIYAPETTYGMVETVHAALLHYWTDLLVNSVTG